MSPRLSLLTTLLQLGYNHSQVVAPNLDAGIVACTTLPHLRTQRWRISFSYSQDGFCTVEEKQRIKIVTLFTKTYPNGGVCLLNDKDTTVPRRFKKHLAISHPSHDTTSQKIKHS